MDRFDKEAADWDNNQDIRDINIASARAIADIIRGQTVLELGSGTGLMPFSEVDGDHLFKHACSWLGVDTSKGMCDVMQSKIDQAGSNQIAVRNILLTESSQIEKHDWCVSTVTFHHIADMASCIDLLMSCVSKGTVIVDYERHATSRAFHPEDKMEGVERHGITAEEMIRICAGKYSIEITRPFTMTLQREGRPQAFPFLLIVITTM